MSKNEIAKRQRLIISMLSYGPMNLNEITRRLHEASDNEDELNFSRSTFKRDIHDIGYLYGVMIEFDFHTRRYYIASGDDKVSSVYDTRLYETLDLCDSLKADRRYRQFILLDERNVCDEHNLPTILSAMEANKMLSFCYYNFEKDEHTERLVKPCFVKESKYRWYLIAMENNQIRMFALERMSHIFKMKKKFDRKSLPDIKAIYDNCFGLNMPKAGEKIEDVVFTVNAVNRRYLESLPLHWSQVITDGDNGRSMVSLHLYITYDFVMELRSMGDIEVIEPKHLKDKIACATSNLM